MYQAYALYSSDGDVGITADPIRIISLLLSLSTGGVLFLRSYVHHKLKNMVSPFVFLPCACILPCWETSKVDILELSFSVP